MNDHDQTRSKLIAHRLRNGQPKCGIECCSYTDDIIQTNIPEKWITKFWLSFHLGDGYNNVVANHKFYHFIDILFDYQNTYQ